MWLDAHQMHVVPRYAEARQVLGDPATATYRPEHEAERRTTNATERRINAAALRLFVELGDQDLTMSELATAAGLAHGTLFDMHAAFRGHDGRTGSDRANWTDVDAVELNEAFAVQSLACLDGWRFDPEIVNAKGGAIAIGHPLGASGGRILGTLAHRLRESGKRWGVAAVCIGVGYGLAVVLENQSVRGAA